MPDQLPLPIRTPRTPTQVAPSRVPTRALRHLSAKVLAGLTRHGVTVVIYGWLHRPGKAAEDAALLRLPLAGAEGRVVEQWYTRAEAADLVARLDARAR